jgi:hypothetical protein
MQRLYFFLGVIVATCCCSAVATTGHGFDTQIMIRKPGRQTPTANRMERKAIPIRQI